MGWSVVPSRITPTENMLLRTNTPAAAATACATTATVPLREYNLIGGILAHSVVRIAPPPPSPRCRPDRLLLLQIPPPPTAHQQRIAFSSRSVGPPSPNLNYLVSRSFIIIGPVRSAIRPPLHSAATIGTDRTNSIRKDGHANQPIPILSGTACFTVQRPNIG